jgi:hypothetical protein
MSAHHIQALPPEHARARKRAIADKCTQACALICLRSPLAFRRSTAALRPASNALTQTQAALHANGRAQALPASPLALKRSTPRAGHHAGGDDARVARVRGYEPRPREPHLLHQSAVTG